MIEDRTTEDLRTIAMAGGGLEIDGSAYSTDDLRAIAMAGSAAACRLIIHNSKSKTTMELREIAMAGKGRVIFA